jgi:hypothetical protein
MKINKKNEYMKTSKAKPLPDAGFNLHSKIDELFPKISTTPKKEPVDADNKVMNYLENTKKPTIPVIAPQHTSPKAKEIQVDDFNYLEVNFQMSKMISRWDEYTKTYKIIYGDDTYDKMYLFPNYNYAYFDMLDNKYEYEQEEMENSESNDSNDDLSDYYIFDKYDI